MVEFDDIPSGLNKTEKIKKKKNYSWGGRGTEVMIYK
jgi:hypothetical protein